MNILKALRIDYRLNKIHFIHLYEYGLYKFNKSYFSITKSTLVDTYISLDIYIYILFLIFLFNISFLYWSLTWSLTGSLACSLMPFKLLKSLTLTCSPTCSPTCSLTCSLFYLNYINKLMVFYLFSIN